MLLNTPRSFCATMTCQNSWMWQDTRLMWGRCAWLVSVHCHNKSQYHMTLLWQKRKLISKHFLASYKTTKQWKKCNYKMFLIPTMTLSMIITMNIISITWHGAHMEISDHKMLTLCINMKLWRRRFSEQMEAIIKGSVWWFITATMLKL
jgi:hypothetical protein